MTSLTDAERLRLWSQRAMTLGTADVRVAVVSVLAELEMERHTNDGLTKMLNQSEAELTALRRLREALEDVGAELLLRSDGHSARLADRIAAALAGTEGEE